MLIIVKCVNCNSMIDDRKDAIYNETYDVFCCTSGCEKEYLIMKDSEIPTIECGTAKGNAAQLYINFNKSH